MSCPICGKASVQKYRPFCSGRCADIDLAKWLDGSYAVASQDVEDAEELAEAMDEALRDPGKEQ